MSTSTRIDIPRRGLHPLVAAAAVAVIVMCSVGVAAVLGWLPTPSANPHAEEAVAEAGPEDANLAPLPAPPAPGAPTHATLRPRGAVVKGRWSPRRRGRGSAQVTVPPDRQ